MSSTSSSSNSSSSSSTERSTSSSTESSTSSSSTSSSQSSSSETAAEISLNPWQPVEVSTELDAGQNVTFVDPAGRAINATHIMLSTGGAVKWREKGQSYANAVTQTFLEGGWHNIHVNEIYQWGTDSSLGLHVMWVPA